MGRRPHPRNAAGQKSSFPRLYGRHAVFAALDNPERVFRKLYITHDVAKEIVIPKGLAVQYGDAADLGRLVSADAPHQGIVLEVEALENPYLGDILSASDPLEVSHLLVSLYTGIRQTTAFQDTATLLVILEKSWILVLPGFVDPSRVAYFSQLVRRRTRVALNKL